MPSVIPYDPSLVLGNIVSQAALENLIAVSAAQAPADAAEETLNSYIAMKRSIDMTIQNLINMNIDTAELVKESGEIGKSIQQAAVDFAKAKLEAEKNIQPLRTKIRTVHDEIESPVDYNKTQLKKMPLAADSLKMNAQYFSYDENKQDAQTIAATIKGFVSEDTKVLGDKFSEQASSAVQSQLNSQYSRHSIAGTLVISITCTHKDALLLAPFILDVDKAIRVWNRVYPNDMIKCDSMSAVAQIAAQANTEREKALTLLSGATYGSCFIGMVHILNTTSTQASEAMYSIAASMQGQFAVSNWFAHESGGFGVDSSFSHDAKNLLSSQNISSHCTLVTMGSIPSIKANDVKMAVQQFSNFDGAKAMDNLAKLQNATAGDKQTVDSAADKARTGQQMIAMENSKVAAVLSGLSDIDDKANKMLDINSMMNAMEDYINKALAGNIGVPINYYLKPVTKSQLAEMWVAKYFPNRYLTVSGDDGGNGGGVAPETAKAAGSGGAQ